MNSTTCRPAMGVMLALASAVLAFLPGCLGYRVGSTLPSHLRSVAVLGFQNNTGEPQLESEIARATLQEFQREGQLQIADAGEADILLNGRLVRYALEPMRYDRDRPRTASEYRVVIRAEFDAVERATGRVIVKSVAQGDATLPAGGDLVTARRNAMPEAARRLAHEIVNGVVSAW